MPRAALQPDDVSAFRKRAVDAAMHLFAEEGYAAVTMRAIGAALGVSAMTSYRYVTGKEELFALVRAEAFRRFGDRLEASQTPAFAWGDPVRHSLSREVEERRSPLPGVSDEHATKRSRDRRSLAGHPRRTLGSGKGDPITRLGRLKQAYLAFALEHPDAYRIMFEVRAPDTRDTPELSTEARRAFGFLHDTVAEAVTAGQLAGDPLTLAHLFWASTHGLVSLHLAGRLSKAAMRQAAAIDHELVAFTTKSPSTPRSLRERSAQGNRRDR